MSDEQKPVRKPHLSPSALEMYAKCGEQYRRRYIEREIIPPGMAMLRGTGVHGGIETNMRQKTETYRDLPVGDVIDAAVAKFDDELKSGFALDAEQTSRGKDTVVGETRDSVATLAGVAGQDLCPKYQPKYIEQAVRIELPGSTHDLLGVIDLADDKARIIDVKTSGKSKSQSDADGSVQLTVYSAMHQVLTGTPPEELVLETLVALKTPKLQTLVTTRGSADLHALAARIEATTHGIAKGVFAPAPSGAWWCSRMYCGYWHTCPFVNSGSKTFVDLKAKSDG